MICCLHTIHVLCNGELDSEGAVCAESSGHHSGGQQRVVACLTLQEVGQRQGQCQSQQVQMDDSGRPATQSHGKLPGAEPRQCEGQQLGMSSCVALEPDQKSAQEKRGRLNRNIAGHQVPATPRTDAVSQMSE